MILRSDTVKDENGLPVPGASIYVTNIDGSDAALTSDGTASLAQPIITDEFGGYSYYANTGYYTESIWYGGRLRWREHNIVIGNPGADLALRNDLSLSGGSLLVGDPISGTVKARLDLLDQRTGTKSEGTLPAGGSSLTPFVINKSAVGNPDGLGDWRAQIEVANFTGAYGATQINGENTQLNILHTAGTLSFAVGRQGYIAIGVPSVATTTGNVSRADWSQGHISHTGSGSLALASVYTAFGVDANVGTGAIDKVNNYRSEGIADSSGSRLTTEGYGYFQANCGLIGGTAIISAFGSEMSDNGDGRRWGLRLTGGAPNFLAGFLKLGGTGVPAERLDVAGNVIATGSVKSNGTAGIGYAAGAGGAITQATSKATGVTLNKLCGQITLNGAALAASTSVSFTLTNSTIAATDTVRVNIASGATAASYFVMVDAVAAGSCRVHLRNVSAGSLSEALVLNFSVLKAVAA